MGLAHSGQAGGFWATSESSDWSALLDSPESLMAPRVHSVSINHLARIQNPVWIEHSAQLLRHARLAVAGKIGQGGHQDALSRDGQARNAGRNTQLAKSRPDAAMCRLHGFKNAAFPFLHQSKPSRTEVGEQGLAQLWVYDFFPRGHGWADPFRARV